MTDRRNFIKSAGLAAMAAAAAPLVSCGNAGGRDSKRLSADDSIESTLIVPKGNAIKITGTFLDEISHDIPHQNWGAKEWDLDFRYMKAMGIDTVILIRSGYRKFLTYPSKYLLGKGCYMPSGNQPQDQGLHRDFPRDGKDVQGNFRRPPDIHISLDRRQEGGQCGKAQPQRGCYA